MALYGFDFYGTALYGPVSAVDFDASPMAATSLAYGGLRVTWSTPSGDWDRIRLVRNSYGSPDFEVDGEILFDRSAVESGLTEYLDTALSPGRFFYYAIFVRTTENPRWIRAGTAFGLTIFDHAYGAKMTAMIPLWLQEQDSVRNNVLSRFLSIFGATFDFVRSEMESLRWVRRPELVSGNLLPLLAEMYGVPHEPALGMRRQRVWVQNSVFLAKTKGTLPGVTAFASTVSGYDVEVRPGPNLLKGTDSGAWFAHSGTVLSDEMFFSNISDADIALDVDGDPWVISVSPEDHSMIKLTAIPVSGGVFYSQSWRARGQTGDVDVSVAFDWFDENEDFISSEVSVPAEISTDWARFDFIALSPANAAFVSIRATGDSPAFLRRVSLQRGNPYGGWAPGRSLDLRMKPNRANLVTNPNFVLGLQTWEALSGSISREEGAAFTGSAYLEASGETLVRAGPYFIDDGSLNFLGSAYVQGTGRVRLVWRDSENEIIKIGDWGETVSSSGWERVWTSDCCQPDAVALFLDFELSTGSRIDAAMLEQADSLGAYFDGSFFGSDYIWSSVPHASSSRYYPARTIRNERLTRLLQDYLPLNQKFTLIYIDSSAVSYEVGGEAGEEAIGIGLLGTMDLGN